MDPGFLGLAPRRVDLPLFEARKSIPAFLLTRKSTLKLCRENWKL